MGNVEDLNIPGSVVYVCMFYSVVRYLGNVGDGGVISRTFAVL